MNITFHKYQGAGNDFILIDNRENKIALQPSVIQQLCDRRFGIGADGLILIEDHPTLDYRMIYFNADGSQSLCGNGSRCGFAFATALGIVQSEALFETTDGIHKIKHQDGLIHFQLFDSDLPQSLGSEEWYLNTGSPHHVLITSDIQAIDVVSKGSAIRNSPKYSSQNGTNVNFAQLLHDKVKMRTYERGVENETLSCGTGATAVGLIAGTLGYESPVKIETLGGELIVSFVKKGDQFTDVWLAGPAEKVFEGSLNI